MENKETIKIKKPKRDLLVLEFSVLSLIAFVIIGYVVLSVVRPAIENFTIKQEESSTVVFTNRHANKVLSIEDFVYPLTSEQKERMNLFLSNVNIRGSLRIFITDSEGTIIHAKPEESIGVSFIDNPAVKFAIERRRATASFEDIEPQDQEMLGAEEAFVQVIPITFGTSYDVSGVVYSISRVGLLRTQIEETQEEMAVRIIGGLLFLYALLLVIVLRASRTIRRQSSELASYTGTLEQRVKERTQELEESTESQIKQAKELARLKDEFVFVAAHELKAPITHLKWTLAEFFSNPELQKEASPTVSGIMNVIKDASESLTGLVSDLLNVARLESGTVKVSVHPTDLISVVQDIVLAFKSESEKQGIALEFKYDASKKFPFAMSDSERLKEVFSNLITNAIKYNKKGGSVEVSVVEEGGYLVSRVADTGIGMTEEEQAKLFTKFWRANQNIEGTGLGLWITKQLIVRMGGKLSAKSEKDKGTTFTVKLPVASKEGVDEGENKL